MSEDKKTESNDKEAQKIDRVERKQQNKKVKVKFIKDYPHSQPGLNKIIYKKDMIIDLPESMLEKAKDFCQVVKEEPKKVDKEPDK